MKKIQFACLLAVLAAVVSWSPARAQTNLIYASPTGTGAICSASAPCSLGGAIAHIQQGYEIACIDGGFVGDDIFFAVSVTIDCPGAVLTSVSGPVLNLSGPSSQVVILRNLTFDGGSATGAPFISVTGGATLIIENCKFQNIANRNAIAIKFLPNSPAAQLIIRDSVFLNNGIAPSTGGGIQVAPTGGGSASVVLERVSFNDNVTAMALFGPVMATMINSTVSASRSNGILVGSSSALIIEDSKLVFNAGAAVSIIASSGSIRLSNDTIAGNQIGISNSGGLALTYSNNRIFSNGTTATLTPVQGGQ